jgi:hypothetical protein
MAWKDTALVLPGGYIDILVDMSNLGDWMLHCHISEHLHAGMMMPFRVEDASGYATGDEYRATIMSATQKSQTNTPSEQGTLSTQYTFDSLVNDTTLITTDKAKYKVNTPEYVTFSFKDQNGNPLSLDKARQVPLTITFVSRDGKDHFTSYPGNTGIHMRGSMDATNVPGSPGFNESMPHSHSLNTPSIINVAHADAGHDHGGVAPAGFVPTYSVPAYFSVQGEYKAFVEYYLEGEATPRVGSVLMAVGPASWSVDNYGWTATFKWWLLLTVSILLIIPLSLFVNRYINSNKA